MAKKTKRKKKTPKPLRVHAVIQRQMDERWTDVAEIGSPEGTLEATRENAEKELFSRASVGTHSALGNFRVLFVVAEGRYEVKEEQHTYVRRVDTEAAEEEDEVTLVRTTSPSLG